MKFRLICTVALMALVCTTLLADVVTVLPDDSYNTTLGSTGWLPAGKTYSLINSTRDYVYWQATSLTANATCQPSGGWISPETTQTITITPVSNLAASGAGTYTDQISLYFEPRAMGDIDGDGFVNATDLQMLRARWNGILGVTFSNPNVDLNGDGLVNIGDMQILLDRWGAVFGGLRT